MSYNKTQYCDQESPLFIRLTKPLLSLATPWLVGENRGGKLSTEVSQTMFSKLNHSTQMNNKKFHNTEPLVCLNIFIGYFVIQQKYGAEHTCWCFIVNNLQGRPIYHLKYTKGLFFRNLNFLGSLLVFANSYHRVGKIRHCFYLTYRFRRIAHNIIVHPSHRIIYFIWKHFTYRMITKLNDTP